MRRLRSSSSLRALLVILAAGGVVSACNAIFGIEPGQLSGSSAAGTGGSAATSTGTSATSTGGAASATTGSAGGASATSTGSASSSSTGVVFDYPGDLLWASTPMNANGATFGVTYDATGNKLFTGSVALIDPAGTSFGGPSFPASADGSNDVFVAKYDANDAHLWSHVFPGLGNQWGAGIATDAGGSVLLTGTLLSSANFGTGFLTATPPPDDAGGYDGADIFVAKLSAAGQTTWSFAFGDSDDQYGIRTAVDSKGNVIVAGAGRGQIPFTGTNKGYINDPLAPGIFVFKLGSDGKQVWIWKFPVDYDCRFSFYGAPCMPVGLAIDASDNIVLVTTSKSDLPNAYVGLGEPVPNKYRPLDGGHDIALWKLDANGDTLWGRVIGGDDADPAQNSDQWASSVAVDPAGNIVVGGSFSKSVRLGKKPGEHVISGSSADLDLFVAKLSPAGDPLWEKAFGDLGDQETKGLAVDASGNIALTGDVQYDPAAIGLDFGTGLLGAPSDGGMDIGADYFIAKLDPQGKGLWAKRIYGVFEQHGMSVALDRSDALHPGRTLTGGWFFGNMPLGVAYTFQTPSYAPFLAEYTR